MRIIGVIPARMGSSRFPGKPLAKIAGIPMVEHVFKRSAMSRSLDAIYVATCDRQIFEVAEAFNARAIMTSPLHERATERVAEVARKVEADIYVMIQADEPTLIPEMIDSALQPLLEDPEVVCSNIAVPIRSVEEFEDPNTIKIVGANNGDALYFSRTPIPSLERLPFDEVPIYKQVCIIPFRRDFLLRYVQLEPTALEKAESIDMLRALEHGYPVRLVVFESIIQSVDTPADLQRVSEMMKTDPLLPEYVG